MSNQSTAPWSKAPLGKLAKKLVNGGTPPTGIGRFWNGKIPWITGADFTSSGVGEFRRFVSEDAIAQTATNVIEQGQLLIVTRTGVGKLALAPCNIAISQDITGFYVDEDQATPAFLYHRMRRGVEDLKKLNQGTSINGIIRADLIKYSIELPPIPQQRWIAEILSTVDEAIEQTEALIAKYQQIKAGLMQDLFTRGVTPDGRLRPTHAQAPHLYKDSPLGRIPREWSFGFLSEFLFGEPKNGYSPQEVDEWSGLYALGLGCLTSEGFKPRHLKAVGLGGSQCREALLQDGDLLLSRSNTPELVGFCGIYRDVGSPCIYPDLMMRIRPNARTGAEFLEALLLSPLMRRKISGAAVGTSGSMVKLNSRAVRRLELTMPEKDEQAYMLKFIRTSREVLASLECDLSKLRQQKHGLMHDLLTGRVRVKGVEAASV